MRLLAEHDDFDVVAEAANGQAALDWLRQHNADIVLLDIEMPGLTGLDVAKVLAQKTAGTAPAIIFCTAYDDYAFHAFKVDAVDYLLKPIRKDDFSKALQKAQRWLEQQAVIEPDSQLALQAQSRTQARTHISAKTHQGLALIRVTDIDSFHADQKYITVSYKVDDESNAEVLIDEPLKVLEREFEQSFIRIHRNALVAKNNIERLESVDSRVHLLYLKGHTEGMNVSRRHLSQVRKLMKEI